MAGGLLALLDDIAMFARLTAASVDDIGAAAARASAKAAGVVIDDTAVTPQFLAGTAAERELPVIRRIAKGSLRNKLLFILPAALLLSEFLPRALPVLLIAGGGYLAFEGAEKLWEKFGPGHHPGPEADLRPTGELSLEHEQRTVSGAIRTDFILSAEIMVIALREVMNADPAPGFLTRAVTLAVVAVAITALVYGVVAIIVRMDDTGVMLAARRGRFSQRLGHGLVSAMPRLLSAIGAVGTVAMLWVGGHILLVSLDELGWHAPYEWVHHLEVLVHDATGAAGTVLGWLTNTALSALVGLGVGAVVVVVLHLLPFGRRHEH
jgi:predicted DNA repair protein MutK